ncbi:MAG: hypothetical protein CMN85_03805 [Spongiibacteraceae bacterium]|nr:hypothetical protein [Spongiibacteraceae bacterium]
MIRTIPSGLALCFAIISWSALGQPGTPATSERSSAQKRPLIIEEIIVTVNKREESLQDVGASVTALDEELLSAANIEDPFNLAEMTPGVVTRGRENMTIRGIGADLIGVPPVAFHENGLFIPNNNVGGNYYDLAAIELLRGPSGTVYGRNATAGALNLRWNPPVDVFEVKADARVASLDERRYRAMINAPLLPGNWLNARLVASDHWREGLVTNLIAENERFNGDTKDDQMLRLWLQSQPADALQLNLRYKYFQRDQYRISSATSLTRNNGSLEEFGADPLPQDRTKVRARAHRLIFSDQAKALFGERDFDDYQIDVERIDAEAVWAMEDLPLLGNVDLTLLVGKSADFAFRPLDVDGTEATIVDVLRKEQDDSLVQELRLASQNDDAFNWIVGVFRARQESQLTALNFVKAKIDLADSVLGLPLPTGGSIYDLDVSTPQAKETLTSEAVYVSGNLRLKQWLSSAPDLELFGGLRINRDEQELFEINEVELVLPNRDNRIRSAGISGGTTSFGVEFEEPTGELGAKWFFHDDYMVYAKFARGYKNGFGEVDDDGELNEVEAEQLNAFEVGSKNRFLEGRLQLNAVAFAYDYSNLQVQQVRETSTVTENAATASLSGLEIDMSIAATANLYTVISLGYLKGTFDDFCSSDPAFPSLSDPGCPAGEQDLSGNDLQDTPRYKASLLLNYQRPLGNWGSVRAVLKTTWTDTYFLRHYNRDDVDRLDSFSNTDLRLSWISPNETLSVDAFVESLEDKDQIFFRPVPLGLGVDGVITSLGPNSPRTWGLQVAYRYP